jgi:hypothetical protein
MQTPKFIKVFLYLSLLVAIPFFLMVYCLRCERLRLSSQKRLIDRLVEEQRHKRHEDQVRYTDVVDISDDGLPERY